MDFVPYHQEHNYREEGWRKGGRNVGSVGVRAQEFRKVGQEPLESKKVPEWGPKNFKIFNFGNFETFRKSCASVDVGIFIAYAWR